MNPFSVLLVMNPDQRLGWLDGLRTAGVPTSTADDATSAVEQFRKDRPAAVIFGPGGKKRLAIYRAAQQIRAVDPKVRAVLVGEAADPSELPPGLRVVPETGEMSGVLRQVLELAGARPSRRLSLRTVQPLDARLSTECARVVDARGASRLMIAFDTPEAKAELAPKLLRAAAVRHPNLPALREAVLDDASPFLLYELDEGCTVREVERFLGARRLSLRTALEVALEVASAVCALHENGLTHGCVRPWNFWATREGALRLLFTGLAGEVRTRGWSKLSGMGLAQPKHDRAPEELEHSAQFATDVYHLGYSLFELLTRHSPFQDPNPGAQLRRIRTEPAPLLKDCPRELTALVAAMLAKSPGERPRVDEVVGALGTLLHTSPHSGPGELKSLVAERL